MEENTENSSCAVKPFTEEERSQWNKCGNETAKWVRVGPKGYIFGFLWLDEAEEIRKMPVRSTDTWVVSFPRSGTTWTQELVWLVKNDLNFEEAKAVTLEKRYVYLESRETFGSAAKTMLKYCKDDKTRNTLEYILALTHETLAKTPSPRFIKSHVPLSLLPVNTLDTCKVVYVARDPRDVAVSCFHFFKTIKLLNPHCELKEFFDLFVNDLAFRTPVFEHVKEFWVQRHHHNMLFLFYEELSTDLKNTAKRVADFFGKTYTEAQFDQLCEHLAFKNFQSNQSVANIQILADAGKVSSQNFCTKFVRKGKAGGWRDEFDAETSARAQAWMQHNLQDTDLRFPLQEF